MKKLFVCALAASMFTACSQDETISQQSPMQISFDGAFVNNATRAAQDPSFTNNEGDKALTAFDVWGFMDESTGSLWDDVEGGEDVNKTDAGWNYVNTAYWFAGHTYYFAALAPQNSGNIEKTPASGDAAKKGFGKITFTNDDGTEDLLYSATKYTDLVDVKTITSQPAPVKFAFSHLLSKVKFTFINGFEVENYKINITSLTMKVAKNATIDLAVDDWWSTNKWDEYAGETTLDFGTIEDLVNTASQESAYERLTFPTDADKEYEVVLTANLYVGDVPAIPKITKTIKISEVALKLGHAYNFVAELNEKNFVDDKDPASQLYPITFEADVIEWDETESEQTVSFKVSNENELKQALATGGNYYLGSDIELTSPLYSTADVVLNLNGKSIVNNKGYVILAKSGNLTINGEGTVWGSKDNSIGSCAVWAYNDAKVVINGGLFQVGDDKASKDAGLNWRNDCIYVSGEGTIVINGGEFKYTGENPEGHKFLLNCFDSSYKANECAIIVNGGKFHNYNPANNAAEGAGTDFVAEGYQSTETEEGSNIWVVTKK